VTASGPTSRRSDLLHRGRVRTIDPVTWFFAIVVVAVIGGVAVVASGRGGSMAETFDDRPDALVPADRPLRAQDLRAVRFSTAFRGYRMSEVDAMLDRLAAEMASGRDEDA
jgi:DivIVA domain-containing protein